MSETDSVMVEVSDEEEEDDLLFLRFLWYGLNRKRGRRMATLVRSTTHSPILPKSVFVSFGNITGCMSHTEFLDTFRLSRKTFSRLKRMMEAYGEDEDTSEVHKCHGVPIEISLAVTLRILAGASYLDLQRLYGIRKSTLYNVFHEVCESLINLLPLPGLPSDRARLNEISSQFKSSRRLANPLSGCVGSLDGISIQISKPHRHERPAAYYCRKGFYSLPVQALVDSQYRFLSFSARCVGSAHDSMAHSVSSLAEFLNSGKLPVEYWICGDEAYMCTESLITPYPRSQSTMKEENFNFFLSSYRVHVEQAFGQLLSSWRILKACLGYSLRCNSRIVCLCMKLHNFCIENNDCDVIHYERSEADHATIFAEMDQWKYESRIMEEVTVPRCEGGSRNAERTVSKKRDLLRDLLWASGRRRPSRLVARSSSE